MTHENISTHLTKEQQERLISMIPPKELADAYVNRRIYGVEDFEVFDWARETRNNLLVKGPTQAAKTLAFRAYAASRRLPSVTVDVGAALDPATTLGTYKRDPNTGSLEPYDGNLTALIRNEHGVLVLDECNMAHPKVMGSYHPLGDARRTIQITEFGETVKAGAHVLIAATMNPDYIGTTPIGQAFSARFTHIPWGYDPEVEKQLISPAMREIAARLRDNEAIHTPVSTHMMMKFQDTIQQMGYDFAIRMFTGSFGEDESQGIDYAFGAGVDTKLKQELGVK